MANIDRQIQTWLEAGIITPDQAELMARHAASPVAATGETRSEEERRVPVLAEILGYVGAALAIWAVVFLATEFWANLTDWAQVGLFTILAVALFVAAMPLLAATEPAFSRLCGVLRAGSVVALGAALFILLYSIAGMDASWSWVTIGAVASLVAGTMLWHEAGTVIHVTFFAGVLTTVLGLLAVPSEPDPFFVGLAVWGVGLIWLLLSRADLLVPVRVASILGGLAMLFGPLMTPIAAAGAGYEAVAILIGLVSAAALAGAGALSRERALVVVGAVGVFVYVPRAMFHFFGDAFGGMFGLFITGLLLVAVAVGFVRRRVTR